MAEPYIGEIRFFPYNFAPMGWMLCDGSQYPVQQYQALFAVVGYTYGGNNSTIFAVPDLRNKAAIGVGTGQGLTTRTRGANYGTATIPLTEAQMPAHSHVMNAEVSQELQTTPTNMVPGATRKVGTVTVSYYKGNATPNGAFAESMLATTGGNAAHENRQPGLTLRACIAWDGVFPVSD